MTGILISACAVLVFLLSAYGWGRQVASRIWPDGRPGIASTAVFGMCLWIFIGGVLNVMHLAYPVALDLIICLGIVFTIKGAVSFLRTQRITSVREFYERWRPAPGAGELRLSRLLPGVAAGSIFVFLLMTQMPAAAFNLFDDFHIYLPRPVRMLQTGSLGGNPFDVLGIDSLGAQAFMQAFFVNRLSASHANAFDAISCFVLGPWMLLEAGRRFGIHGTFLLASAITFIVIDPQYVNVSSLYSGSLMILALMFVSIAVFDDLRGVDRQRAFSGAVALALIVASLVSLKTTFVVFVSLYLATYFGCALLLCDDKSRVARSMFLAMLATVVLIAPWALLSLPNYAAAMQVWLSGKTLARSGAEPSIDFITRLFYVFSPAKSSWGGDYLTYSLLVSALALAGIVLLVRFMRSRDGAACRTTPVMVAACVATAASYLVNIYLFDPQNGLRYSIPVLIATASATVLLAGSAAVWSLPAGGRGRSIARTGGVVLLATAVVLGGAFADEMVHRVRRAFQYQTLLPFPALASREYRSFMAFALGETAVLHMRDLQNKVEKGYGILALVRMPLHFDFARNRVFNMTDSTVLNPWLGDFLPDADAERTRRYLLERGVRYVMFEYGGFGVMSDEEFEPYLQSPFRMVRQTGERNLLLRKILRQLAGRSRVLAANPGIVVFDIAKIPPPAS